MQETNLSLILVSAQLVGRHFYPGYLAPFAVQAISGAARLQISPESCGILCALTGTIHNADNGVTIAAPCLTTARGNWISRPDTVGWIGAFHPSVINQEFAAWPLMRADADADPLLKRDQELLACLLPGAGGSSRDNFLALMPEEAIFLNRLFASMVDLLENQNDAYWPCRSRSFFLEVLYFIWKRPAALAPVLPKTRSHLVHEWLRTHYPDKISIASLSDRFATNRTSLQELFKQQYGTSVMDFLGEVRTEAACILMRNTELSLAEIGTRVGFADYSNFYREFRRRREMPPHQYRKTISAVRRY